MINNKMQLRKPRELTDYRQNMIKNMEPSQTQITNERLFQIDEREKGEKQREEEKGRRKRKNLKRGGGYALLFVKGEKEREKRNAIKPLKMTQRPGFCVTGSGVSPFVSKNRKKRNNFCSPVASLPSPR